MVSSIFKDPSFQVETEIFSNNDIVTLRRNCTKQSTKILVLFSIFTNKNRLFVKTENKQILYLLEVCKCYGFFKAKAVLLKETKKYIFCFLYIFPSVNVLKLVRQRITVKNSQNIVRPPLVVSSLENNIRPESTENRGFSSRNLEDNRHVWK